MPAEKKYPKQWENTKKFYQALVERSEPVIIDDQEVYRYTGAVSSLFKETLPRGLYGDVRKNLTDLKCIIQTKRGGGIAGASEWYLVQDPESAMTNPISVRAVLRRTDTSVAGKFRSLHERVSALEKQVVSLHRKLQVMEGEQPQPEYIPSPRISDSEKLKELVDMDEKLSGRG